MHRLTVEWRACFLFVVIFVLSACTARPTPVAVAPTATASVGNVGSDWQAEWQRLVTEARKEGEVRIYSLAPAGARREVAKGFKEKYGIEVDFVAAPASEIASRLEIENKRGIYLADVINIGGGTHLTVLKPQGIVQPIAPALILPDVLEPKVWRAGKVPFVDEEKTFLAMNDVFQQFVLYNTNMVKEGEITSIMDLLKPQWKGKITWHDPTVTGTGLTGTVFLARLWGMDRAKDYLRELVKQEPVLSRDKRQTTEWVARGKYPVNFSPSPDVVVEFLEAGAPLVYPRIAEGGLVTITAGGLAMPSRPAHPNASKLLINWILTKEGQTSWVKGIRMPGSRLDVSTEGISPSIVAKPENKVMMQNEEHFLMMDTMRPINNEILGGLLR